LRAAIGRVAHGLEPESLLKAVSDPRTRADLVSRLIDEVTVKETYFLRNQPELDEIDWECLLEASRQRGAGGIRAWSTPCATGEEAYSLAILALETLGAARPPVSILATDIAQAPLVHAELGRYGKRSVRHVPAPLLERHFRPGEGGLTVAGHVRELVRFARHNLVSDQFPPPGEEPFDLIVCRNVLIYFDPPTVTRTVRALRKSLVPGGQLVLGAADRVTITAAGERPEKRPPTPKPRAPRPRPPVARRRRPTAAPEPEATLEDALAAADKGQLESALQLTDTLLAKDTLNPGVHFVRGLALQAGGDSEAAVASLRRALYLEPAFVRAAFELGRAHETLRQRDAARRSYQIALRALEESDDGSQRLLDAADAGDVAAACQGRLGVLEREEASR
jgi:chemotaxis protein methyltransferase CheR